jgi:hypothetical protein
MPRRISKPSGVCCIWLPGIVYMRACHRVSRLRVNTVRARTVKGWIGTVRIGFLGVANIGIERTRHAKPFATTDAKIDVTARKPFAVSARTRPKRSFLQRANRVPS